MKRKAHAGSRLILLTMAAVLASMGLAYGQAAHHKVLTPDQQQFQADTAQWFNRRKVLRTRARTALSAELAREKSGDCPKAETTRSTEQCLEAEIAKTQSNYALFADSIRAMLALPYPTMPGEKPVSGPTGTPPSTSETVAEFDQLEAESKRYREDATKAAYNQYKGGTLAPVIASEAERHLLRLHFQELAFIYGEELSNH